jgi:HAD superfamily hydrolase (TIGR01509 family)
MPSPAAVIFDMDGVLVDTEPIHIDINLALLAEFGVVMPMKKMLTYVGISANRFWREARADYNLPHSVDDLIAIERERLISFIASAASIPEVPGVRELLTELAGRDISLAVASSSATEVITALLAKSGLISLFQERVSGQNLARGKPAPDIFMLAAEKLRVRPKRCLVIEDSSPGVAGAKAAGMACVGFANPNSGNHDLNGADLIIGNFSAENRRKIFSLLFVER